MNKASFALLLLAGLAVSCTNPSKTSEENQVSADTVVQASEWQTLFNGKDLTGWKVGGPDGTFKVENGAIAANGFAGPGHLFYDGPVANHQFRNFDLKLDVMAKNKSNGGVYVLTEFQQTGFPGKGFEIQVNNSHTDRIRTGSLYNIVNVMNVAPAKDNEWFTQHIIVQSKKVTIKVNGKTTVEYTEPADVKRPADMAQRLISKGTFALQGHDPKSRVHYKNIMVKPLN